MAKPTGGISGSGVVYSKGADSARWEDGRAVAKKAV